MKNGIARSPLFYVGDKYKLVREIRTHFPAHINRLIEPFVGGGSVMMNVDADGYLLNDINCYVISLHRMLQGYIGRGNEFINELYNLIDNYGLSLSLRSDVVPKEMKVANPKTYYARYNKAGYQRMKADFINGGLKSINIGIDIVACFGYGTDHISQIISGSRKSSCNGSDFVLSLLENCGILIFGEIVICGLVENGNKLFKCFEQEH